MRQKTKQIRALFFILFNFSHFL